MYLQGRLGGSMITSASGAYFVRQRLTSSKHFASAWFICVMDADRRSRESACLRLSGEARSECELGIHPGFGSGMYFATTRSFARLISRCSMTRCAVEVLRSLVQKLPDPISAGGHRASFQPAESPYRPLCAARRCRE
jgi:hypothetical protein